MQTYADELPNGLRDAAVASVSLAMAQADPGGQEEILAQLKNMSERLDTVEKHIQPRPSIHHQPQVLDWES